VNPATTTTTRNFVRLLFTSSLALCAATAAIPAFALSVSLTAPAAGAVVAPGTAVTVSASVTPTSGKAVTKVEFFAGTTLIGTDTTSPYSISWTNVQPGTYSLTAKATDSTGATATSAARSIRVNNLPSVSLTAPANGANFTPTSTISLAATASDTDGTISQVQFFQGTTLLGTDTTSPYSFSWTSVVAGSYALTAKATDNNSGVTTSTTVNITVDAPPTVSLTAPANNAVFLPGASITVSATAADTGGSVSKVEFFDGATLIGTDTTSPYSIAWTGAATGTHTITAKATDNQGVATSSAAVTIRVDAPPGVSLTAPANNAVFVAPASITLSATASDTDGTVSKVEFLDGTTIVGTVTAAPYSVTLANIALGTHSYTARATDNNNAVTTSSAVSIIVNTAPTVSITAPANNAFFTTPANITITASAADSDGTVTKVDFFDGATLVGTATSAPYSFTIANAAGGSHALTARATDNRGTTTTSAAVNVTVDAPPTVSITAPANNALFTAPATFTLTASAADTDGTVAKVEFLDGATIVGTVTAAPYSITLANVALGAHSYTARATDNQGAVTTSTAISVLVNAAPTVSISSPANNALFVVPANITVTASAADTDGTVAKVDFYDGATLLGTATASPYSFTIANAAGGSHVLSAKATDDRGAVTSSAAVTVLVDAPPSVSLTAPANNAVVSAPANITLTAAATDTDGTIAKVDFFQGTTLIGTATAAPYSFAWTNVAAGTYSLTAVATDNQGTTTISAAVALIVNTLPTVSISSPASGAAFSAPATITLAATAADADGTIAKVDFYQGTTLLGTSTAAPYSFSWTNVAGGSYSLTAVATDDRGGTSTSAAVSITANAPPSVSITSPANGATLAAPADVTVTATASDPEGSLAKVDFYQDATLVGTVTTAPYSITLSQLVSGSYALTAVATDGAGATTTSTAVTIRVNTAPTVSITSPTSGATSAAPANITLAATASDLDGTIASVAFYYGTTLIATRTTPPYTFTWTGVPQGSYSLTAVATDDLGTSTTSTAVPVTVNAAVAQLYYIHTDHLNTPRLVADSTGTIVWKWDQQEPFGVNVPDENPSGLGAFEFPLRFPGQYFNKETNLAYNYYRNYDASVGRFVESDPIGLSGGINTYLYAASNPLTFVDPTGLCFKITFPIDFSNKSTDSWGRPGKWSVQAVGTMGGERPMPWWTVQCFCWRQTAGQRVRTITIKWREITTCEGCGGKSSKRDYWGNPSTFTSTLSNFEHKTFVWFTINEDFADWECEQKCDSLNEH
jgi:RHS repeat-associated protein